MNKDSYNKIAVQWDEYRGKLPLNKCIAEFCPKLKPGGKVLDIGCGSGSPIAKHLSDKGFAVTGIDISEKMLEIAAGQNIPNAQFILCDFFEFQTDEKFDGIIAFDSFFHFPKTRQAEIYQKVSGLMAEGAYLLFTHGDKEGEAANGMFGEEFYYSALDTQDVHRLLKAAGLQIELSIEQYVEHYGDYHTDRGLLVIAKK